MNYTYEQLKYSFDNILKELDDICRSIDDLTDIDKNFNLNKDENNNSISKNLNSSSSSKSTPLLSNFIGSAQECTAAFLNKTSENSNLSPMATNKIKIIRNQNSINQVSFSNNNKKQKAENEVKTDNKLKNDIKTNNKLESSSEDNDYLSPNELLKIESFYSSMDCFVYVSNCIAQLYQIKREDEFDCLDIDPVNDYQMFLKNKFKKEVKSQNSYDLETDLNEEDILNLNINKSTVNYMYLTCGVPVIIFNKGNYSKRKKNLRIVLAERSTGFCMFEFKFDHLTQFDITLDSSLIRLSKINFQKSSTYSNTFSYQNEFFEKYFNSKNRHAYKEHLLKFIIKQDWVQFCSKLKSIMNDKRNSEYTVTNETPFCSKTNSFNHLNETISFSDYKKRTFYNSNYSLNSVNSFLNPYQNFFSSYRTNLPQSSTLIICHFDLDNTNQTSNLNTNASLYSLSLAQDFNDTSSILKTNIKPVLKKIPSTTSSNIEKFSFDKTKYYLNRKSRDLKDTISINVVEDIEPKQEPLIAPSSSVKKSIFTRSISNLEEFRRKNFLLSNYNPLKTLLVKSKKLKKSDISSPVNFNHITHLDKPVPIGKRYKVDY